MTTAYGDVPLLDPETGRFPDSFTPPMYAKGIAGGVAALDADGDVVDAGGNKVA